MLENLDNDQHRCQLPCSKTSLRWIIHSYKDLPCVKPLCHAVPLHVCQLLWLLRRLCSTLLALPQDSQRPLTTSNQCYKSHTQWALKDQGGLPRCLFPLSQLSQTFSYWNIHYPFLYPSNSLPRQSRSPYSLQRSLWLTVSGPAPGEDGLGWAVSRPLLKSGISESLMSTKAVSKLINNCQARGKAESCMAILKAHQRVRTKSRVDERCGWPLHRTHAHIHKSHMHLTNIASIQSRHWDESISKLQTEQWHINGAGSTVSYCVSHWMEKITVEGQRFRLRDWNGEKNTALVT